MNHPEIDERQIVEHYVAGKLSDEEAARFEEHYLECPACVQEVEDAERLHRGLELAATQDLVARRTIVAAVARLLGTGRGRGSLLVAALLAVALLPAGLAWQRAGRLDDELGAARRELEDERRPRINTPVLELVASRAGEQPLQQISLAPEPEWIVIAVELGDAAEESYIATLTGDGGAVVWTSPGLMPSYRGNLTLSLHSSLLPEGLYVLGLDGPSRHLRFPLRVVVLAL